MLLPTAAGAEFWEQPLRLSKGAQHCSAWQRAGRKGFSLFNRLLGSWHEQGEFHENRAPAMEGQPQAHLWSGS